MTTEKEDKKNPTSTVIGIAGLVVGIVGIYIAVVSNQNTDNRITEGLDKGFSELKEILTAEFVEQGIRKNNEINVIENDPNKSNEEKIKQIKKAISLYPVELTEIVNNTFKKKLNPIAVDNHKNETPPTSISLGEKPTFDSSGTIKLGEKPIFDSPGTIKHDETSSQ